MKKSLFAIVMIVALSTSAFAADGVKTSTAVAPAIPSPIASSIAVQVIIPSVLGVDAEDDLVFDLGDSSVTAQTACTQTQNVFPFKNGCTSMVYYNYTNTLSGTLAGAQANELPLAFYSSDNATHTIAANLTDALGSGAWGGPGNFYISNTGGTDGLGLGTVAHTAMVTNTYVSLGNPGANTFAWTRSDKLVEFGLDPALGVAGGTYNGRIYFQISR